MAPGILPPRELLIQTLKEVYTDDKWFKGKVTGPKLNPSVFINLALVKKKIIAPNDKKTDKLLRDSLHGLVDDIERKKERIHVHDIFNYGRRVKRVLVEGAPGIGKTMLACYLCSEWAKGEILKEYDCVKLSVSISAESYTRSVLFCDKFTQTKASGVKAHSDHPFPYITYLHGSQFVASHLIIVWAIGPCSNSSPHLHPTSHT